MLFRWMGVHAAWPHFLVLCLVFEGMKRRGGWTGRCWQGGAGQAHHWPLTGPSHLINDPWIRYRAGVWGSCVWTSNTYGGTKVCVFKLHLSFVRACLCVQVWDGVQSQKSNYLYSLQPYTSPLFLFLPLSNGLFWRWPWQAMVWILIYVPVKLKSKIPSTAALWQLGWWMVQSLGQTKPLCLCPTF